MDEALLPDYGKAKGGYGFGSLCMYVCTIQINDTMQRSLDRYIFTLD